jgi:hypothetical protein
MVTDIHKIQALIVVHGYKWRVRTIAHKSIVNLDGLTVQTERIEHFAASWGNDTKTDPSQYLVISDYFWRCSIIANTSGNRGKY